MTLFHIELRVIYLKLCNNINSIVYNIKEYIIYINITSLNYYDEMIVIIFFESVTNT